jgi:UDP-N-acetylmuramate dehydrogenase
MSVMITIEENVSLLPYNSFRIDVNARRFCRIDSVEQLQDLIRSSLHTSGPHLILGEGSNILFTKDYAGLILRTGIKGIERITESDDTIVLKVGGGESWHEFVMYCVDRDFGGIENLSLIPGTCGAAPIQNIGAYGVEIENRIENVVGVDMTTGELRTFQKDDCMFNYRESVFKHELREKYFISSITLSLTKKNHFFNIRYGVLHDTLKQRGLNDEKELSVKAISDAVIQIRQQKLPVVGVLGSAGSFFKNPVITQDHFTLLKKEYPLIPSYPSVNQNVKLSAAWLIEQCGWKGKRIGNIGVHEHQALVLVNYGGGSGTEIFQLAVRIHDSVKEKFNVILETEVNIA